MEGPLHTQRKTGYACLQLMPAKKRLARDQAYPSWVKVELWAILAPKSAHLNAKL